MTLATMQKPLIRIDSEVTRRVRRHARAHMHTEVCGVLIGKLCDGIIEIEAPIEAFNAAGAGAHVTFTQAAWETIYRVKDKDYPDDRIVGWYHSHPGFGVFLSDHDTFIHRNFFSSPDQVAWVYDPHSDEEGCFGWVDGSIRRLASIYIADNSGDEPQTAVKRIDGGFASVEANAPWRQTQRPLAPSPKLQKPPGLPARFTIQARKFTVAGVSFARLLRRFLAAVKKRVSAIHTVPSPSAGPESTEMTYLPRGPQSGDGTKQLPAESGQ